MSRRPVICKGCGTKTCKCPSEFPPEWQGYCPTCAVGMMFAGELPRCDEETLKSLVLSNLVSSCKILIEVVDETGDTEGPDEPEMDMAFTGTGQVMRYHPAEQCRDFPCPMHSPSEHHMREWPMHGRSDLRLPLIERLCPHNALHPDPDSLAWALRMDPEFEWYHGACDGCCKPG